MNRISHLELAKWFWERHLASGDVAIDATCGNGHDTLFLAKMGLSSVIALDIQELAIQNTTKLLKENLSEEEWSRVSLHQISHEDLAKIPFPASPKLIVYNLGYLPGGDKNLTTKTGSTLSSIESALSILGKRGALSVTCYPGHEEGKKEEQAILQFISSLPLHTWDVFCQTRPNRPLAPRLIWITRLDDP